MRALVIPKPGNTLYIALPESYGIGVGVAEDMAIGAVDDSVEAGLGTADSAADDCALGVSIGGDIGAGVGSAAQAIVVIAISAIASAAVKTLIGILREVNCTLYPCGLASNPCIYQ